MAAEINHIWYIVYLKSILYFNWLSKTNKQTKTKTKIKQKIIKNISNK